MGLVGCLALDGANACAAARAGLSRARELPFRVIDEETGEIHDIPWEAIDVSRVDELEGFEINGRQMESDRIDETVVFHPGFYGELTKEEATKRIVQNVRAIRNVFMPPTALVTSRISAPSALMTRTGNVTCCIE